MIAPNAGTVRVTLDNDGAVTTVESSVRPVDQLLDRAYDTAAPPPFGSEQGTTATPDELRATDEAGYQQLLAQGFGPDFAVSPPDQALARRNRVFPGFVPSLWAYLVRQVCRRWPECKRFVD